MFAAHLRLNNCLIVTVRSLTTALNSSRYVSNVPMATNLIQRLTCSNGQCSHLPLCHTDLTGKETMECKSEGGATDSTASCSKWRTFQDGSMSLSYRCTEQSCENAFILDSSCDRCTSDVSCRDSEVCREGQRMDACIVYSCRNNTECTASNHDYKCMCVSPWVGDLIQGRGCREQALYVGRPLQYYHGVCNKPYSTRVRKISESFPSILHCLK